MRYLRPNYGVSYQGAIHMPSRMNSGKRSMGAVCSHCCIFYSCYCYQIKLLLAGAAGKPLRKCRHKEGAGVAVTHEVAGSS